ncbi:MAG TPA: serine protease [Pyrinomonadaceae bacterium]|nr:serine protease [Pyrinomonadaceae bacterium]
MKLKNIILLITLCLFFSNCSIAQNKSSQNPEPKINNPNSSPFNVETLLKKQILLTNNVEFTNNRAMNGASGFLIKHSSSTFAVTARHLLGEAGGVEPEVKINDLSSSLKKWEMMPRVVTNAAKETVKLDAKGLDFSNSLNDIVLLKVISTNFEIEVLTPNFNLPTVGEKLFLIGCPYSETKCKQNPYPLEFVESDESENLLIFEIKSTVDLRGFSGAPVVNAKGEVYGVLVSGGAAEGKNYAVATNINEIKKIKF